MSPSPLTPPPSQLKGFTLLELLVVIVIVAVLAGLIVPSLGGSNSRNAADAAERLVLLVNQAQQEAVLSSRIWMILFDPAADSYRFLRRTGSDFEQVTLSPFSGDNIMPTVNLEQLEINGEAVTTAAEVYLFPTGEQDSFRVLLKSGDQQHAVAMGPIGPARLEQL